jgi:hypothetical protein
MLPLFSLGNCFGHFSNNWAFLQSSGLPVCQQFFTFSMYSVSVTPSITILCHYADPALMLALFGLAIILAIFQTIGHF